MSITHLETDYFVIGSGTMGMRGLWLTYTAKDCLNPNKINRSHFLSSTNLSLFVAFGEKY